MDVCQLDKLPVELIHHLLSYFSAHEIFYTFTNVTSYIDAVLSAYSYYSINFKSISRKNFDLVCQHIKPDQVITLTLSDDEDTPGLAELFLSRFQINQFTRLQLLRLIEIGPDYWENIITKLIELKHLRSFLFLSLSQNGSWISHISGDALTQLDRRLFDSYAPVLSQLYRLQLNHSLFLESVQFPSLHHLILRQSTVETIRHICSAAPQISSLETSVVYDKFDTELTFPVTKLHRLVLRIEGSHIAMNDIEGMMTNLLCLKHLELVADCKNDVADGERWQIVARNLITFNFLFNLFTEVDAKVLDSFRTSFWIEEKRWFVACQKETFFSAPRFIPKLAGEAALQFPLYSTVPNNEMVYNSIVKLDIDDVITKQNHYFPLVQTLGVWNSVDLVTIKNTVNLNNVQHLILYSPRTDYPVIHLINEMPNLHRISFEDGVTDFLEEVHYKKIKRVRSLDICGSSFSNEHGKYDIKQLSNVFPNVEHLCVTRSCTTRDIFDFLHRFKHLSTASFKYTSWFLIEKDPNMSRDEIRSEFDRLRNRHKLNYLYRFDSASVHVWIS